MRIPIVSDLVDKLQGSSHHPDMMLPSHNINFTQTGGTDYPESFFRNQTEIRKVNSQEGMMKWVEHALLSRRCKDAIKSLISNLYDDNIILSYHQGEIQAEIAFLKAKVYLKAFVTANSYKSDVYNPVWGLVMHELYYQLELRYTRTIGGDRERIVQGKIVQQYEIAQGVHNYDMRRVDSQGRPI